MYSVCTPLFEDVRIGDVPSCQGHLCSSCASSGWYRSQHRYRHALQECRVSFFTLFYAIIHHACCRRLKYGLRSMEIFQAKNRGQTVVNTKEGRSLTVDIKLSTVSILHRGAPSLWNHGKLNNLEDERDSKKEVLHPKISVSSHLPEVRRHR